MKSAWPASLGALLVIAVTMAMIFRDDPLEFTTTSYGTLPNAFGALHDVFVALDVPIERSFAAPAALPAEGTVWWIEPRGLCEKLAVAEDENEEDAEPKAERTWERDWEIAAWIEGGGTALLFAPQLADCLRAVRVGSLTLPLPVRPALSQDESGEDETPAGTASQGVPAARTLPAVQTDWDEQAITGAILATPRALPVPTLRRFEDVPEPFSVVALADGAPFALEAPLGAGRLVLIADSVFLRNLWLDAGDAAPLAFDFARAYGVPHLDEREHGLRDSPSTLAYLAASPALPVFGGLAASGLLFLWSGASLPRRRIGQARPDPPTLRSYIDSLARLYARAGDHAEVFAHTREITLAELRRALNLPHDAPATRVHAVLRKRPGVDPDDLALLRSDPVLGGAEDLQRASDALDRLREALR